MLDHLKIPSIDRDEYHRALETASAFHGHLCAGMYTGVKMSLGARHLMDYDEYPSKDLIVTVEIDRCLTDAIISMTGCRLGRRTLKFRDWGRFGATFHSLERGMGIRIAQRNGAFRKTDDEMKRRGIDHHADPRSQDSAISF